MRSASASGSSAPNFFGINDESTTASQSEGTEMHPPQPQHMPSYIEDESDDDEGVKRVRVKLPSKQLFCRSMVCVGGLAFVGLGAFIALFGVYGAFASPSNWLPSTVTDATAVAYGSLALGATMAVCGIVGCAGAFLQKKPLLCLFGLVVLTVLAAVAGGVAIIWETQWSVNEWRAAGFRLQSASLDGVARETLKHLHTEVAGLYHVCQPSSASTASITAALSANLMSAADAFACESAALKSSFEAWVRAYCVDPSLFPPGTTRYAQIQNCRSDATALGGAFVQPGTTDASWLFCACAEGLADTLSARWFTVLLVVGFVVLGYLVALVCILHAACKGAAKAKKRRKQAKDELQILHHARMEAGGNSADDDD